MLGVKMTKIVETAQVGTWWQYGFGANYVLRVRLSAQDIRRRFVRRSPPGKGRLAARRGAKGLARVLIGGVKKKKLGKITRRVLMVRAKQSFLAKGLMENRQQSWLPLLARVGKKSEINAIDLANFSFIHNPVGTIEVLRR